MKEKRNWLVVSSCVLAGLFALPLSASEVPPSWGELTPGPYAIGFRVFLTEDRSRGYWPLRNYRGDVNAGPTNRPLQISVWYPASRGTESDIVRYGDYVELQESALGESHREAQRTEVARELREEIFRRYFPPDGPSDAELEAILNQPTAAIRNASYAPGQFPLVIHSGFGPFAQSVLLEYLASHGYVVMTTHMMGSSPAWFHRGSGTLEWLQETARDIGFMRAFAADLSPADVRRTAVIGMIAAAGLLDQMSSMHTAALVGIEASFSDVLLESAAFEPARVRIPLLKIVSRGNTRDEEVLRRLVFADRWAVRLDEVDHVDFYQFRRLLDREHALEHRGYATAARLTRRFLDMHLKQPVSDESSAWLETALKELNAGEVTTSRWPAEPAIPTEDEFLLLVREGRRDEATEAYRAAARGGHTRFFDAEPLRTMAIFRLYDDGDAEGATEALRILVDAYPEDAEGWRFLGRSLYALGDLDGSREALERAAKVVAGLELTEEERSRLLERIEQDLGRIDEE